MLRKKLVVLVAAAMMMATVASPAWAAPQGNNGNHSGDVRNEDNGLHVGGGTGGGKFNNPGNGGCGAGCEP